MINDLTRSHTKLYEAIMNFYLFRTNPREDVAIISKEEMGDKRVGSINLDSQDLVGQGLTESQTDLQYKEEREKEKEGHLV